MYAISEFEEWVKNYNFHDAVYYGLEFLCTFKQERKEVYRLDMNQKIDKNWHTLHVFSDRVIVSFNAYYEDTYIIDTTLFSSSEITEEEYFQYCTIQEHLHLTEADFRAIVRISKYVENYNANS